MSRAFIWATVPITILLSSCSIFSHAEYDKVANVTTTELRVCFNTIDLPLPGQDLHIMRRQKISNSKPPQFYTMKRVGLARITSVTSERCVIASVLEGSVRTGDEIRWLGSDVKYIK